MATHDFRREKDEWFHSGGFAACAVRAAETIEANTTETSDDVSDVELMIPDMRRSLTSFGSERSARCPRF